MHDVSNLPLPPDLKAVDSTASDAEILTALGKAVAASLVAGTRELPDRAGLFALYAGGQATFRVIVDITPAMVVKAYAMPTEATGEPVLIFSHDVRPPAN